MGTEESLGRGSVQFMTAGTGIRHSEFNSDKERGLRFIQTWIVPRKRGLKPNYGSFDPASGSNNECSVRNEWRHLVSDVQNSSVQTPVEIEQDANLYVIELDRGHSQSFTLHDNRMAYVLCVEGSATITLGESNVSLQRHDGCEVAPRTNANGAELVFSAESDAHVLVYEMEFVDGNGRTDF